MDQIGIIKQIDNPGRICIPKEIRDRFALTDKVEILLTPKGILICNPTYELSKKKPIAEESRTHNGLKRYFCPSHRYSPSPYESMTRSRCLDMNKTLCFKLA